jgi:predicted enzyme related to lactoylglutathione lyase
MGVTVPVSNFDRAADFYGDVLGLQPSASDGKTWAQFMVGNNTIQIMMSNLVGGAPGNGAGVMLFVEDANGVAAQLKKKKVDVSAVTKTPSGEQVAKFKDPDGNLIGILQPR